MDQLASTVYPATEVSVYVLSVGGNTEEIMAKYASKLYSIKVFNPTHIILHSGNNEFGYHPTKNPVPKDSTQATQIILDAATILRTKHPQSKIALSAAFPRLYSRTSSLSLEDLVHYNKTAKRHSSKNEGSKLNFSTFMNNMLWKSKDDLLVKPKIFLTDGLHLTEEVKKAVITDWIKRLRSL
jgi:hypothetical protein